jgi:hypothetical protein
MEGPNEEDIEPQYFDDLEAALFDGILTYWRESNVDELEAQQQSGDPTKFMFFGEFGVKFKSKISCMQLCQPDTCRSLS